MAGRPPAMRQGREIELCREPWARRGARIAVLRLV